MDVTEVAPRPASATCSVPTACSPSCPTAGLLNCWPIRCVARRDLPKSSSHAANEAGGPDNITALILQIDVHNLAQLFRYRGLIQSLVARELKARYRGSVLGFFWSFINPLLLLLVYSFVFKYMLPQRATKAIEPVRVVPVLRDSAVDVVLDVAARVVRRRLSRAAT